MIEPTEEMVAFAQAATCGAEADECIRAAIAAVLAIVERDYVVRPHVVVHQAVKGDSHVHCCGTELLDLPRGHRWTTDPHGATCRGAS